MKNKERPVSRRPRSEPLAARSCDWSRGRTHRWRHTQRTWSYYSPVNWRGTHPQVFLYHVLVKNKRFPPSGILQLAVRFFIPRFGIMWMDSYWTHGITFCGCFRIVVGKGHSKMYQFEGILCKIYVCLFMRLWFAKFKIQIELWKSYHPIFLLMTVFNGSLAILNISPPRRI